MIDAHIHLQDKRFDPDRDRLIEQAVKNGVSGFLCASTCPEDSLKVLELSQHYPCVTAFIGTHPWSADQYDREELISKLNQFEHIGIGEIGLDSLHGKDDQETVFIDQFNLAAEFKRPCAIHCVKSFDRMAEILKQAKKTPPALLFHGFNGTKQQVDFLMRYPSYFSFSGSALFENKTKQKELIKIIPADRLLVETDAPDMRPPDRFCLNPSEKRNTPDNLPLIIQAIAAIRKTDISSFVALLNQNAHTFLSGLKNDQ